MSPGWVAVFIALWVVVVVSVVLQLGTLRLVVPLLERAQHMASGAHPAQQGPPVGTALPEFEVTDAAGVLQTVNGQCGSIIVFLRSGCGPCRVLADELGQVDLGRLADEMIIVTDPGGPTSLGLTSRLRVFMQACEGDNPLNIRATPFALAVDGSGIVAGSIVPNRVEQLRIRANLIRVTPGISGDSGSISAGGGGGASMGSDYRFLSSKARK